MLFGRAGDPQRATPRTDASAGVDGGDRDAVRGGGAQLQRVAARAGLRDDGAVAVDAVAGDRGVAGLGARDQPIRAPVAVCARTRSPRDASGRAQREPAGDVRGADRRRGGVAGLDGEGRATPEHDREHHRGASRLPHGAPGAQHAVG